MSLHRRHGRAVALALAMSLPPGLTLAQSPVSPVPDEIRRAPPEIDRSRPGGDPAAPQSDRTGSGPTGNDIVGDSGGGRIPRGVIEPPMTIDPGIHTTVPDPTPRTTPVIPPPGTPGGDPTVIPR